MYGLCEKLFAASVITTTVTNLLYIFGKIQYIFPLVSYVVMTVFGAIVAAYTLARMLREHQNTFSS